MGRHLRLGLHAGDRLDYRFCQPAWQKQRRPVPLETLLAHLDEPASGKGARVTLADAPLAHPSFSALVRALRDRGLGPLSLETDGAPLTREGVVEALVDSGFDKVFVVLGGIRKGVHEAVLRDEGLEASLRGLQRALASPLETYVIVPVVAANRRDLVPLFEYVQAMGGKLSGYLLSLPEVGKVPSPFRRALLPYPALAEAAADVFSVCQRAKVEYGFFPRRGVLPCGAGSALDRFGTVLFERLHHLKNEGPGEPFTRIAACATCSLEQSCKGVEPAYLELFGDEGLRPVPLDVSMDWKLKRINRLEQRAFKELSAFDNDAESNGRSLVRVNGHCNMSCAFCFIDRTVSDLDTDALKQAIDRVATRNLDHLVLSGGEPTLHPHLDQLIAHGRSLGFRTIEVQSNGVRMADMGYARSLVDAGLTKATISLHSADPAHSDKITRLPGGFAKTVRAMHNLRELGVLTQVAHVITRDNYLELPDTVRFLRKELPPEEGHLSICFGIAQPISDLVYTWVMPRFDEIRPHMREALDLCLEAGIGFGGMIGQGGYPPCMLGGDMRYYEPNLANIYRSEDADEQFYKAERCRSCSFDEHCLGVRRYYVDTYGDGEITPFEADIPRPARPRQKPAGPLVQLRRGPGAPALGPLARQLDQSRVHLRSPCAAQPPASRRVGPAISRSADARSTAHHLAAAPHLGRFVVQRALIEHHRSLASMARQSTSTAPRCRSLIGPDSTLMS